MGIFSYEGIGEVAVTVFMTNEVKPGAVVRMEDNEWAGPCADGELFCGVALKKAGDLGTMQVKGFACVPVSGAVTQGWVDLVADGNGGVRPGENGVRTMVFHVNSDESTAVICL